MLCNATSQSPPKYLSKYDRSTTTRGVLDYKSKYKTFDVLPIRIVNSNVSSV